MKVERLQRLGNRQIILYPDADGIDLWEQVAAAVRRKGLSVKVSALIEMLATSEQKANGYDLADYLIEQQKEINEYNNKLDLVLSDNNFLDALQIVIEEQKAIAIYNGATETEADALFNQPKNIRNLVWRL